MTAHLFLVANALYLIGIANATIMLLFELRFRTVTCYSCFSTHTGSKDDCLNWAITHECQPSTINK